MNKIHPDQHQLMRFDPDNMSMRIETKSVLQRLLSEGLAKEIDRLELEHFRSAVKSRVVRPLLARRARQLELIEEARRKAILSGSVASNWPAMAHKSLSDEVADSSRLKE